MLIDDILVYFKNEVGHVNHLRVVLQILKEHQLYAKFSKCEFWLNIVTFLGHTISSEGILRDLKKVAVVKKWLRPTTPIDIRSFLGLAVYYQRFVESFTSIATLLTKLT